MPEGHGAPSKRTLGSGLAGRRVGRGAGPAGRNGLDPKTLRPFSHFKLSGICLDLHRNCVSPVPLLLPTQTLIRPGALEARAAEEQSKAGEDLFSPAPFEMPGLQSRG